MSIFYIKSIFIINWKNVKKLHIKFDLLYKLALIKIDTKILNSKRYKIAKTNVFGFCDL